MQKQSLGIDAWMREAQDALNLVEDVENSIKDRIPQIQLGENYRVIGIARSKLQEAGVKLDRLESLLRNPPSKPVLTNEDLEYRWEMLLDIQLRTKSLAVSLYGAPPPDRTGSLSGAYTKEVKRTDRYEQDQMKVSSSKDDPELQAPLLSNHATKDQEQINQCDSSASTSLLQIAFRIFCVLLISAALLILLFLVCAIM